MEHEVIMFPGNPTYAGGPMSALTPENYAKEGSEHAHQVALFMWANDRILEGYFPDDLRSMFAIPVGGKRSKATASMLKAEGVKAGVSDIFLPTPRAYREQTGGPLLIYHGLFIELKTLEGYATDEQKKFIALMKSRNYAATVCRGWECARDVITSYLKLSAEPRDNWR